MTLPVGLLVAVYLAFVVKHLLADYFLQTGWMVRGKEARQDWLAPLAAHAGCHALGTLAIVLFFQPALWWLALVDFVVHTAIDRGKALVLRAHDAGVTDPSFWRIFGSDQALHQLTHFAFVVAVAS